MITFKHKQLNRWGATPAKFAGALAASAALLLLAVTESSAVLVPLPANTPTALNLALGIDDNWPSIPAGSILSTTTWSNIVSNTGLFTFSGKQIVWKETATGNIDFFFQVTNDAASIDPLNRVTISGFGGVDTLLGIGVGQDPRIGGPAINPINPLDPTGGQVKGTQEIFSMDRSVGTGNTLGFNFPGNQTGGALDPAINPGESTLWWVLKTSAKEPLGPGSLQAIDGGVAFTTVQVPVPEPTTILFGLALGFVAIGARQRRCKTEIAS